MTQKFEPFTHNRKANEFSAWEFKGAAQDEKAQEQEILIDEAELLRQTHASEGYAQGMQQAQEEINALKAEFAHWMELIQKPIKLLDDQLTHEIIQTVIWLCHHCIGVELSVHPDKLQALFEEIKAELPVLKGRKILAMNQEDMQWVKEHFDEKQIPGLQELLTEDSSLGHGDFYLQSDSSELDGRVLTRLVTLFAKYIDKEDLLTPIKTEE